MPQIQYSEKYYDDVYEYRCARAPTRLFPGARAGTGIWPTLEFALRARRPVGFLPATRASPIGPPSDAFERRDTARADRPSTGRPLEAFGALKFSDRLLAARIAPVFRARARSKCYPSHTTHARLTDPFSPPPPPVSGTSSSPPTSPSCFPRVAFSLRCVARDIPRSTGPRRPVSGHRAHPACPRFRDTSLHRSVEFSKLRLGGRPVPRTPSSRPPARVSRGRLTLPTPSSTQAEWRGLGVQQSRGWVHYAIHRPEPHIMLYRCARRPPGPTHAARFSRALFQTSGRRDLARPATDPRAFHPDTPPVLDRDPPDGPDAPRHPLARFRARFHPLRRGPPHPKKYPQHPLLLLFSPTPTPSPPDSPGARSTTVSPRSPTPPTR